MGLDAQGGEGYKILGMHYIPTAPEWWAFFSDPDGANAVIQYRIAYWIDHPGIEVRAFCPTMGRGGSVVSAETENFIRFGFDGSY